MSSPDNNTLNTRSVLGVGTWSLYAGLLFLTGITVVLIGIVVPSPINSSVSLYILIFSVLSLFAGVAGRRMTITIVVRVLACLLFAIAFAGLTIAVLSPEFFIPGTINSATQPNRAIEIQIFASVSFAGALGGLVKYLAVEDKVIRRNLDLWHLIQSAMIGLFVALVIFMILRAGIINQSQVDTFNIWGVSGVSAITGFFGDKVTDRFSNIFSDVLGGSGK